MFYSQSVKKTHRLVPNSAKPPSHCFKYLREIENVCETKVSKKPINELRYNLNLDTLKK